MLPVTFEGVNDTLRPAPGDEDDVLELPIYRGRHGVISCWELAEDEIADILRTRRVYLVVTGATHPPLMLMTRLEVEDEKEG